MDEHDLSGIDLSDLERFASGAPHDDYRRMRDHAPVHWNEPTEHTPDGEGFWSLTRTSRRRVGGEARGAVLLRHRRRSTTAAAP